MKLNKVINLQNKEAMTKTITFNELHLTKNIPALPIFTLIYNMAYHE